ncbi:MAG: hypothetical protein P8X74_23250 [Reinekea sp.]
MLPKNWGEPMGAPTIFEKQKEIKFLHPTSTLKSRIQDNFHHYRKKGNRVIHNPTEVSVAPAASLAFQSVPVMVNAVLL